MKPMIKRTFVSNLKSKLAEQANIPVEVVGFVQAFRDQGKIKFIQLRDRTGLVQLVVLAQHTQAFRQAERLHLESVIHVQGLLKATKQTPQGFEIEVTGLTILSLSDPELPIPVAETKGASKTDVTKRFDWRWLDLRRFDELRIFQVWTVLEKGFRQALLDQGFLQIYSPSLMNTASESGAEVFAVKYFETQAYLAQSPQFYKQMAMAAGFERVFMVGPVYRAELSFTTRHMTEFTGWDFEMSYIDSHHDVMDMEERALITGFQFLRQELALDLDIPTQPFPRLSLAEVKAKLAKKNVPGEKKDDLSPLEEREISKLVKQETGSDFVFVIDYPVSARPFYHMRHADNPQLTKSFDLLYKGVEVTTGAQREHRYQVLIDQAKEKGMSLASLENYLNFFKYGCPPHGGVGIGPGRLVMKLLDLPSVKEATFLPRDVRRLTP